MRNTIFRTLDDLTGDVVVRIGNSLDSVELARGPDPVTALAHALVTIGDTHAYLLSALENEVRKLHQSDQLTQEVIL